MARTTKVVTTGTGRAADHLSAGPGDHVITVRWAGSAGAGTLQERPTGGSDSDWADVETSPGTAADVNKAVSFRVAGNRDYTIDVDTHTSAASVTIEACE